MEWDALHSMAKAAIPASGVPPKRYMVGVLLLGKSPQEDLDEFDFLWITAHAKINVRKIRDVYMVRYPGTDVDLMFKDVVPADDETTKSLNQYGDDIVVLRAVERKPPGPEKAPTPLRASASVSNAMRPASTEPRHSLPALSVRSEPLRHVDSAKTGAPPLTPVSTKTENAPAPAWDVLRDRECPSKRPLAEPSFRTPSQPNGSSVAPTLPHNGAFDKMHSLVTHRDSTSPLSDPPLSEVGPLSRASSHVSRTTRSDRPHGSVEPHRAPSFDAHSLPVTGRVARNTTVKTERRSPPLSQDPTQDTVEPFNLENVFKRDTSQDADNEAEATPIDRYIREIINQQKVEILEAGAAKSRKILEDLRRSFSRYAASSPDASAWMEAIDKLSTQAERTRTVVGVVGNTGAGKSSVINAMLDEERLVPTNCMRACTAVVTEISWNASTNQSSKYRAEIEFISRADWEKELGILLKEFLTDHGTVSREISDPNSDAGIAWAKFHAVYPKIHKDMLGDCTVQKLIDVTSVVSVLGTTKRINQAYPDRFYTELQKYVDSKEKVTGKKDKEDKKKKGPSQMEYWPLIKVVKIYTKSVALSTGAVIVDLPGVHDSNAARAAVADRYMKQCTGLWIVAPINRAVDDKAAKTLLGDSFKRQLKYDGNYSSVTFICSKTDDISITEAAESLELDDRISTLDDQQRTYAEEIENAEEKISDLKESMEVYRIALNEADDDIETWEDLKDQVEDGKTAFAPVQKAKNKRKKGRSGKKSRKRRQVEDDNSDIEYIGSDREKSGDSESDSELEGIQAPRKPLTKEDIKCKLEELKSTKKNARQETQKIRDEIRAIKPKKRELEEKIAEVQAEMSAICIAGRNEYSKGAIQQDFAAGIKELDMENAAEDDEENFNPDEDIRDYDEVARSLPVFCVSSRAYQKMNGRLKKDGNVPGFKTPEETQIPQLQAHCKQLTEAGRIQACRTFLLSLCQQLTTFSLWASNDGTGLKMTDEDKQKQVKYLTRRLDELDKGLQQAVEVCLRIMKQELHSQIFDKYDDLVQEAISVAPETAQRWGSHRDAGGIHYSTYKAIVRRNGAYQSATAGYRDFNAELIDPILKKLATGWERAFQTRLPKAFEAYTKDSGKVLHSFHETIEERARQNGVGLANLAMLKQSIYTYEQMFQDLNVELLQAMTELQREANRDFTPTIANAMANVYDICTDERGTGSFMRMKNHMHSHVERERHTMFGEATGTVEKHLKQMCRNLEEKMANKSEEIFVMMRADYMRVLGGVQVSVDAMSREERELRAEIKVKLLGIDAQFEMIANGELEEVQDNEEGDEGAPTDTAAKPLKFDDDADSVFDSTKESVQEDDTMYEANDDTVITEPSPSKSTDDKLGDEDAGDDRLPTPGTDDEMDEEL